MRGPNLRRALHDDEARPVEVIDEVFGDDLGHDLVGVVGALPSLEPQRVGERGSEIGGIDRGKGVGIGHGADDRRNART